MQWSYVHFFLFKQIVTLSSTGHSTDIGYVTATFEGSGNETLDFGNWGNSWGYKSLRLYFLNAEANINEKSKVVSFENKRGDLIKVAEEKAGIIKTNSFTLEECANKGNAILEVLASNKTCVDINNLLISCKSKSKFCQIKRINVSTWIEYRFISLQTMIHNWIFQ